MNQLPTILEAAARIRGGDLTPVELVEDCLARIARRDGAIRAWVDVDADAARRLARQRADEAAAGQWRGPLHGIPLGVKDAFDVAGWPTRAGSPLRAEHRAEVDAPVVAALRRAGAILLGKTVTVEFACFDPSPTRNPWSPTLRHTPGGSSSGSAAAVALGMCLGAIGTQTGGSLVRPAGYCGVATLKPTFGRLSTDGVVPVSHHLDHVGPMGRRVADLHVLFECMRAAVPQLVSAVSTGQPAVAPPGRSAAPGSVGIPAGESSPANDWTVPKLRPLKCPPRVGVIDGMFDRECDAAVGAVSRQALERLRAAGADLPLVDFPEQLDLILRMHRTIMAAEAAVYHRRWFPARRADYGPKIASLLDEGLALPAVDYAEALAWQRAWACRVDAMFEHGPWSGADVLAMPSTDTPAPPTLETTGTPKFQALWSMAGVPVVSLPCGLSDDGMPVGLQLIGRRGDERQLLSVAAWCESALGFDAAPPEPPDSSRAHRTAAL